MSKACEGVKLTPMRLADLVKNGAAAAPSQPPKSHYIIPSKRAQPADTGPQQPTLSVEEMKSEQSFPTLGPMKPATSGASWGQIRARLAKPLAPAPAPPPITPPSKTGMNFKEMIDNRILRDKEEAEKQPVEEEDDEAGWHTLSLQKQPEQADTLLWWDIAPPKETPMEEEWTGLVWPSDKTFLDGSTIDPSKPYTAPTNDQLEFTSYCPESLQRARNRMLAFIGKKPAA
jgi:hypothetical protein